MKITPINYQNYQTNQNASFKATYPVVHWVSEAGGNYAPMMEMEIVKKLQGKIVRILNKALNASSKPMNKVHQNLRSYISSADADYRRLPKVRSFYDRVRGNVPKYSAVSYLISGKDVATFEDTFAKEIGRTKSDSIAITAQPYSPAAIEAIEAYNRQGLGFVNNPGMRIKDMRGDTYVLHTKFEIVRNKKGEVKDYRLVDARFLPEYGQNSPFIKFNMN